MSANPRKLTYEFIYTHLVVLIIFSACVMMAGPMRYGLPVEGDLESRLVFISQNIDLWRMGWYLWMLSALGLLLFATFLSSKLSESVFRKYGLSLVALGIAPDLIAEVIYAFIIPMAIENNSPITTIGVLESLAMYLTGFLGNGLYNIGGLILNILLIRQRLVHIWIGYFGVLAWILGIGLSVSIATSAVFAAEILTGLSMTMSTIWMILIAYSLFRAYDL